MNDRYRELRNFADNRLPRTFQEPNGAAERADSLHLRVQAGTVFDIEVLCQLRPDLRTGLDIGSSIAVRAGLNELAAGWVKGELFISFLAGSL